MSKLSKTPEIENLKKSFDKVYMRHTVGENNRGGKTEVVLQKGNKAFVGVAFCYSGNDKKEGDVFSKARGRQIAIGRALHAFAVFQGKKKARPQKSGGSSIATVVEVPGSTEKDLITEQYV